MPYRIDLHRPPDDAFERLVSLGALDVEPVGDALAAIIPDGVTPRAVAEALGVARVGVSRAVGRDDGSVWILSPRPVRAGGLLVTLEGAAAPPGALRLTDSPAFGSGLHPTTFLCLEILEDLRAEGLPERILDVGTGSGVLALAALMKGARSAVGLDTDARALEAATRHVRLNHLDGRLALVHGGPDAVHGTWPLVLANVLAAPLMEMAPLLIRRVGTGGQLVLSGIPHGVAPDVEQTYARLGMRHGGARTRAGWTALRLRAPW